MERAVLVVGLPEAVDPVEVREYRVVALAQPPGDGAPSAWHRFAGRHGIELSASWLVCGPGISEPPEAVRAAFRGYRGGVMPRAVGRVLRRLDAEASVSRVVTDFATVQRRCERIRRSGRRLVFTNGVFDMFHVGHLRLLQAAGSLGGALVVGINSDDSTRRLKGRTRPVVTQFARAEVVAGVRGVDLCVIFPQPDPRQLIRAVRPDVLVKGSEYSLREVVGRRLVESWGGRVERIPHVAGWSSTQILRSIKRA